MLCFLLSWFSAKPPLFFQIDSTSFFFNPPRKLALSCLLKRWATFDSSPNSALAKAGFWSRPKLLSPLSLLKNGSNFRHSQGPNRAFSSGPRPDRAPECDSRRSSVSEFFHIRSPTLRPIRLILLLVFPGYFTSLPLRHLLLWPSCALFPGFFFCSSAYPGLCLLKHVMHHLHEIFSESDSNFFPFLPLLVSFTLNSDCYSLGLSPPGSFFFHYGRSRVTSSCFAFAFSLLVLSGRVVPQPAISFRHSPQPLLGTYVPALLPPRKPFFESNVAVHKSMHPAVSIFWSYDSTSSFLFFSAGAGCGRTLPCPWA